MRIWTACATVEGAGLPATDKKMNVRSSSVAVLTAVRSMSARFRPARRLLAGSDPMKRFEARFHPNQADRADYVVVGYVVWDANRPDGRPRVEAAVTNAGRLAPHAMFSTLRHLVRVAGTSVSERLKDVPSRHWSFVDISAATTNIGS